ncbi:MAG: GNAT family N-acetyltransferase, partial [Aristaeellaceae bacterium]
EIVDFAVLEKFRGRGVGSKLMDAAEAVAFRYADTLYLGVGLHSCYGAAQRMVIPQSYVLVGSGVWYGNQPYPPYAPCGNNDDLVLYLSKRLCGQRVENSP